MILLANHRLRAGRQENPSWNSGSDIGLCLHTFIRHRPGAKPVSYPTSPGALSLEVKLPRRNANNSVSVQVKLSYLHKGIQCQHACVGIASP
jgi:hypothetical protein